MYALGIHLDLCDPAKFAEAWERLANMTDADCDNAEQAAHAEQRAGEGN